MCVNAQTIQEEAYIKDLLSLVSIPRLETKWPKHSAECSLRLYPGNGKRTKVMAEYSNPVPRKDRALHYFQNIVETVREPLVLPDLPCYESETAGRLIYELDHQ